MATRLYLSNQAAAISPAFGGWSVTADAVRKALLSAKDAGDSNSTVPLVGPAGASALAVQFIGEPLSAQTISGTIKGQARFRNSLDNSGDNASTRLLIRVVSNDGSVVRGTLLSLGAYGPGSVLSSAFTNRILADGDALSSVDAQDGDRLVVEVGVGGPSDDDLFVSIGAPLGTNDLPEDETTTTALVPWVEFSGNLVFQSDAGSSVSNLPLLGVG